MGEYENELQKILKPLRVFGNEQGLLLQTMQDFTSSQKRYSYKTNELQGA